MNNLISFLKSQPGFVSMKGASPSEINDAESKLNLSFSQEYKEFLQSYGCASFSGHEILGLCSSPRLNVIDVTRKMRNCGLLEIDSLYVIEVLNMDGLFVCQHKDGEVVLCGETRKPECIAESIEKYLTAEQSSRLQKTE